jgi:hypothetical protein
MQRMLRAFWVEIATPIGCHRTGYDTPTLFDLLLIPFLAEVGDTIIDPL